MRESQEEVLCPEFSLEISWKPLASHGKAARTVAFQIHLVRARNGSQLPIPKSRPREFIASEMIDQPATFGESDIIR